MPTKLNRWGNSLSLRLPQHIVESAGLAAGDYLYLRLLDSGEIMIRTAKLGKVPAEYRHVVEESEHLAQRAEAELEW